MLDAAQTEEALASSSASHIGERDVITVSGPEAEAYLQGQISQDVAALSPGASAWSFVLQPQGKVDAWFRITRTAPDGFVLDLDHGHGEEALARLLRFKLRTDADFTLETRPVLSVRGPASQAPDGAFDLAWPGANGFDLIDPDETSVAGATLEGTPEGDATAFEVFRIRHGIPMMGRELDEKTIPAEAGIVDVSVSFTKGCYVGQELVARVDSRGNNTPRNLVGLTFEADEVPEPGAELIVDGDVVGRVTSSVRSAEAGPIGLGYVSRKVDVPGTADVVLPSGSQALVRISLLPF